MSSLSTCIPCPKEQEKVYNPRIIDGDCIAARFAQKGYVSEPYEIETMSQEYNSSFPDKLSPGNQVICMHIVYKTQGEVKEIYFSSRNPGKILYQAFIYHLGLVSVGTERKLTPNDWRSILKPKYTEKIPFSNGKNIKRSINRKKSINKRY